MQMHARYRTDQCSHPGCVAMAADDGASTPDVLGLCSLHRQRSRNKRGVCPNCSSEMLPEARMNEYTKRLVPDGKRCRNCGYHQRPRR